MPNGIWFLEDQPLWKKHLDRADECTIQQTGLSREKLEEVLEILYESRVING
jgi:hypothetical protein